MNVDPFVRGPMSVGVQTKAWCDVERTRVLPVEIYYPATSRYAGADLDPMRQDSWIAEGSMSGRGTKRAQAAVRDAEGLRGEFPLVLFAHGYSGDRREFTGLCTHLASHGYRVVSADHVGSTYRDVATQMRSAGFDREAAVQQMGLARFGDVPFLISTAEQHFEQSCSAVGVTGASMGGWTSLVAPSVDERVRSIVPLCPGGGEGPLNPGGGKGLASVLNLKWRRKVEMLTLVGDRDSWLPLYGQLTLFRRCPTENKRLVVLRRADHNHFVDDMEVCHGWYRDFTKELERTDKSGGAPWAAIAALIRPFSELMPEPEARSIIFGLATLHFDASLRQDNDARNALERITELLAERHLNAFLLSVS